MVDAFAGLRRVYVELGGGYCGAALSPTWLPWSPLQGREVRPGQATPRSLVRLVERTRNPLAAAFAVAAVNAATAAWILETIEPPVKVVKRYESLTAHLGIESNDRVVMLGYMRGLAASIEEAEARLLAVADYDEALLEQARRDGHHVIDPREAPHRLREALREASVVLFSGSALLDPPTLLDEIRLAKTAGARLVALVGATSSLHPAAAEALGVDAEAGVLVEPEACPLLRETIAGGGGIHRTRARLVHWIWRRRHP